MSLATCAAAVNISADPSPRDGAPRSMEHGAGAERRLGSTGVMVRWTAMKDGDQRPLELGGQRNREGLYAFGRKQVWLSQVHGSRVVRVTGPEISPGEPADALVSARDDVCLTIFVADCAPVVLASREGVMAAVHAGWRGLMAGVVHAAVTAMASMGATEIIGAVGPCVHAECYEFSARDLDAVASRFGDEVRSTAAGGQSSLDLPAAVSVALREAGVSCVFQAIECTACSGLHFSHRAMRSPERQAMLVWRHSEKERDQENAGLFGKYGSRLVPNTQVL